MFDQTRWLPHSDHIKSKNSENLYHSYHITIYRMKLSGNVVDRQDKLSNELKIQSDYVTLSNCVL